MTGRKQATRRRIGPPPPIKRKTVFLNYTQAELNAQYDQGIIGTDRMDYRQHWMDGTARARRLLETRLDIPYGRADVEKLDIYLPAKKSRKPAPVMIFFHGGAWRALTKDESAAYAPAYADAGAMIVVPDFGAAPETTLSQMVAQVRRAVAWTWKNIADYGGDPNRLIVAGHSSGAHMAGTTLADGWRKKAALPENAIKGGVLFSGAYDLTPVRLSARNDYLKLSPGAARRLSITNAIPRPAGPLVVGIAEGDLHDFRRQGRALAAAWKKAKNPVEFLDVDGVNHFDMGDVFADPASPLGQATLRLLRRTAGA